MAGISFMKTIAYYQLLEFLKKHPNQSFTLYQIKRDLGICNSTLARNMDAIVKENKNIVATIKPYALRYVQK